jgi:hypothetical protein
MPVSHKSLMFVLLLFLVLSGCEAGVIVVTPTPALDPTPTQEVFYCEFDCSAFAVIPINDNACLCPDENGLPHGMGFRIDKRWADGRMTQVTYQNGHYVMDLVGPPTGDPDAAGFTGDICVAIYGLELETGQTYAVHLEGYSQLDNADYFNVLKFVSASANIQTQWGRVDMPNTHDFKRGTYPNETVTEHQDFWWYLRSDRPMPHIAALEVCIHMQEAVATTGNHFRIDAMYVVPVNGHPVATEF